MSLRWSRISPQLALLPAFGVLLIAFLGSIGWTILMSSPGRADSPNA